MQHWKEPLYGSDFWLKLILARRPPMFVFAFDASLFRFKANAPAFAPLSQFALLTIKLLPIKSLVFQPAADNAADLINFSHPDAEPMIVDVAEHIAFPDITSHDFDLNV